MEDHTAMSAEGRILRTLKEVWGFDQLRPWQADAIDANLQGRDSLLVLPTGGGKSLTYQLPSVMAGKLDVVVSPLLALMKDQVDALVADGVAAAAWHGNLDESQRMEVRENLLAERCRLLYLSPEMLMGGSVTGLLQRLEVRSFTIDEAHCISQWGHDFRPKYRLLSSLRRTFPGVSLHACTATATPRVRDDIVAQLGLRDPVVLVGSFDRPNLTYRIHRRDGRRAQVLKEVRRHGDAGVIVYALTRKDTETIASQLVEDGVQAVPYHAGLGPETRVRVQDQFARETINVVVATVAFGMGIDRSNIRAVIHAAMPRSIEHYQQETGRAGRDGEPADCVLLYSYSDVDRWRSLARRSFEEAMLETGEREDLMEAFAAQDVLLQDMTRLSTNVLCRHRAIVEYFGGEWTRSSCGACDVCLDEIELLPDSSTVARKILSCVARVEGSFGVMHVAEILCGSRSEAVKRWRHDDLSTWGLLGDFSKKAVVNLIHQLIEQGVLRRTKDERPVITFNTMSRAVLLGEVEIKLMQPPRATAPRAAFADDGDEDGVDHDLFEALRVLRRQVAAEIDKPAYVIFGDRTLRALARHRPSSLETFRLIHGVGAVKLEAYGPRFLEAIDEHCGEESTARDVGLA